jgi:type IV pilus assembly protein PilW
MSRSRSFVRRERGFSLIEVMVGIVIALIAVLVIYQVFSVSEGIKRNATGAGDAQQNGLLSTFTMMMQFSNAGANLAVVGDLLDACPADPEIKTTLRPIPVLIHDSGSDTTSDDFVASYGASQRTVTGVNFASTPTITITDDYKVQSPLGFQVNDIVVVMSPDSGAAGHCARSMVTAASAADGDGYVTLTHSVPVASPTTDVTASYDGASLLLNLGPAPRRIRFQVDETNNTLGCVDLLAIDTIPPSPCKNDGFAPVPISNNIVLMKVQYGLGDPTTGYLQKWVKATNDGTEDWTDSTVLGKDYVDLSRIKAVRIALVVRSESYDKCAYADKCPDPTSNAFSYTLFGQCDGIACPAAITGTLDPTPGLGNFRYRVYETVVPLRNAVWNIHKKT